MILQESPFSWDAECAVLSGTSVPIQARGSAEDQGVSADVNADVGDVVPTKRKHYFAFFFFFLFLST